MMFDGSTTPSLGHIAAAGLSVTGLFCQQVALGPARPALLEGGVVRTYAELGRRVDRVAGLLARHGVGRGDRVAVLSENRSEYLELMLAAAQLGAIIACQNWRQSEAELSHCIGLAEPRLLLTSPRFVGQAALGRDAGTVLTFGPSYDDAVAASAAPPPDPAVHGEDGLLILYTSGTTGLPKGALISQRALVARTMINCVDLGRVMFAERCFPAWAPLFHMASADMALGTLLCGGSVALFDGFEPEALAALAATEPLGHLTLMPGTIERMAEAMERTGRLPRGITTIGAMPDLVPRAQLERIMAVLDAPYRNTFGSTETGTPPAGCGLLHPGRLPARLSKQQSSFCEIRLLDDEGRDVPDGEPGALAMRGPSLFSGYWNDAAATAESFAGGWYHMGDVFVRNPDATLDFVDRRKYLIKSGGENIYPAELERLLLASPRVTDAVVVRQPDPRWGEVPVAVVVPADPALSPEDVLGLCRGQVANYKLPKGVRLVTEADLPRSTTGKIKRHEVEAMLARTPAA